MTSICPKGHTSTDPDYCSECGARMDPSGASPAGLATPSALATGAVGEPCPDCMTPRPGNARYCEVCRYDFVERKRFAGLPVSTPTAAPATTAGPVQQVADPATSSKSDTTGTRVALSDDGNASTPNSPASTDAGDRLKLRVVVDPTLYTDQSLETTCPTDTPPKVFHLDLDEHTLGRQYEGKGIHPEIVIADPGISRRHLKFVRTSLGGYTALELGSSNGTMFNGAALEAGVEAALHPGDQFTLGMWTRITVETR